jgi:hypothetical protein
MRAVRDFVWLAPLLAAAACGSSPSASSSGASNVSGASSGGGDTASSGASATSGTTIGTGSGTVVGGATGSSSGSVVAETGSATSGSVTTGASGSIAPSGSTGGSGSAGSGTDTGGMVGSSTGHGVEPPSLDCPNGCNTDAGYPQMMAVGTPVPIGDQTLPRKLYIENQCTYTIWTLGGNGIFGGSPLKTDPGEAYVAGWANNFSGRLWPRSGCNAGGGDCTQTGNDTLAEFTLTAGMNSDWYDISLVDGFTIPLAIIQMSAPWTPSPTYVPGGPLGADQECGSPVCAIDLNPGCPASQQEKDGTGNIWGCKNGQSGTGGHAPTPVTAYLKAGCPTSYTNPYDDPQSLFLCLTAAQNGGVGAKDYKIIYCPTQGSTPGFP